MDTRERRPQERPPTTPAGASGSNAGSRVTEDRQRMQELLGIGDQAIDSVLSGDSSRFLQESRQRGGQ